MDKPPSLIQFLSVVFRSIHTQGPAAQEQVALARSLIDLYNHRHSDLAWLEKSVAAFATDCEVVNGASGTTLHGPESFPDSWQALSTEFATEDGVVLEGTFRRTNSGPPDLLSGALPATGHAGGVPMCHVLQIRHGKIVSIHCYYDLTTLLEYFGLAPATRQAT